ncbi:MAG: isochorismatase family protein [Flavobacteriia bacterium]|nr:isochorismatase family protein [Flavobacteriia bacterium]
MNNAGKEAIIVIDVQKCFLPGGSLATTNERNKNINSGALARGINKFIQSKPSADIFITQDWHTPGHTSFADPTKGEVPIVSRPELEGKRVNTERYATRNFNPEGERFWGDKAQRHAQALWPEHCVQGTEGAEVAEDVLKGLEGRKVEYIYKGDEATTDSYSAIADALGFFTPHLKDSNESFKDILVKGNYSKIYITGIARDVCVFWTALDLLNYITLPNAKGGNMSPKVVYIYDLTRPVFGAAPAFNKTKEEIEAAVKQLMGNMGVDSSQMSNIFEIMDSNTYAGGRRRKMKTRKNCWPKRSGGARKGTRKPKGHKPGCKCPICKRR